MTSSMTSDGWTVSVDGGPPVPADVTVTQEWEYIRSYSAVLPDPKWRFIDSHGHEHRWAETGRDRGPDALPTLVQTYRHVECDGSCGNWDCDGYDLPVWHCRECGDEVEPGFKPDYEAQTTGIPFEGMRSMSATVKAWPFGSRWVSGYKWMPAILVDPDGQEIRATVMLTEYERSMSMHGETAKVELAIRPEVTADA